MTYEYKNNPNFINKTFEITNKYFSPPKFTQKTVHTEAFGTIKTYLHKDNILPALHSISFTMTLVPFTMGLLHGTMKVFKATRKQDANPDLAFNNLKPNLSNGHEISKVSKSDKIQIHEYDANRDGLLQKVGRPLSKIFQDAETTKKILTTKKDREQVHNLQIKTWEDLSTLKNSLNLLNPKELDPKEIENILWPLIELHNALKQSTVNLRATYEKERAGRNDEDELLDHFLKNATISEALIIELGEVIQTLCFIQTSADPKIKDQFNSALEGVNVAQDFIEGIQISNHDDKHQGADGKEYTMSHQFLIDLKRSPHFSLNGNVIYSNLTADEGNTVKYTIEDAYQQLYDALGKSEHGFSRFVNLTTQGMIVDTVQLIGITQSAKKEKLYVVSQDNSFSPSCEININGDKVHVTLKNGYVLKDGEDPESHKKEPLTYQLAKREFTFSLKEIQDLAFGPLPMGIRALKTVEVKDTYSPVFTDQELAIAFYRIL